MGGRVCGIFSNCHKNILNMYRKYIKRTLDIILSGVALLILSPLLLILYLLVRINLGKPVFFSQERVGKDEKVFKMYKFRSMNNARGDDGELLPEDQRTPAFGAMLRSLSLDELPELWIIFTGKMSIVGPRPMPTYYLPYYIGNERKRHTVRGGLVSPESLSRKVSTTYEEQFEYEVNYTDNVTFLQDCKIILATFIILYNRMVKKHGGQFRPHLNVYRAYLDAQNNSSKQLNI